MEYICQFISTFFHTFLAYFNVNILVLLWTAVLLPIETILENKSTFLILGNYECGIIIIIYWDSFPPSMMGWSCLVHINHFCRIDDRDELSRSSNGIIESAQFNDIALYWKPAVSVSSWKRTRAVYTSVCPANHLAITAVHSPYLSDAVR